MLISRTKGAKSVWRSFNDKTEIFSSLFEVHRFREIFIILPSVLPRITFIANLNKATKDFVEFWLNFIM